MKLNQDGLNKALTLLNDILLVEASPAVTLVVCGGSALIAQNLVARTTRDVDVVALQDASSRLVKADPLPEYLLEAVRGVAREMGLPDDWLNSGPSDLFQFGLPTDFENRMTLRLFGTKLKVYFASRYDQIHFKIYAAADQGPGRHLDDLLALHPNDDELRAAACWAMTHDDSEGFRLVLQDLLKQLGHGSIAAQL